MSTKCLAAIAAVTVLALSACGKEEPQTAVNSAGNMLLNYVSAATPYLAANLERTPDEVIDSFLQKAEPVLTALQGQLDKAKTRMESITGAADRDSLLALALLQELDGKLNRPGLESLGFDLQAPQVFYGMGVFPVARIGLSDAVALKDTVQRILANAGIKAPEQSLGGQKYWRLSADDASTDHPGFNGALYVAILQEHVALSIFPTSAEGELLPLFLGIKKPEISDARQRLQAVNAEYGFTPYFTGLLDLPSLADELLLPDTLFTRAIGEAGKTSLTDLSSECKNELRGIVSHTPRLVAGTTELTPNAVGLQYIVETRPELAKQLAGLVADMPTDEAISSRILEFSFGLKFGPVRDFLREAAKAITESPYRCEHLQRLNSAAQEALAKLDQPMPPLVNNFQGLRLGVSRLSMNHSMPETAEGLLAVHVEQPEIFVGMAQMFVPDLASLNLAKNSPPVQIPPSLIPMPDVVAFAAMSDNAIGVSFGAGEEKNLKDWLEFKTNNGGTFISVNYDTAAYLDFTQGVRAELQNQVDALTDRAGDPGSIAKPETVARDIAEAVEQAYKAVAGRTQVSVRFTESGMVIDSRMTFR